MTMESANQIQSFSLSLQGVVIGLVLSFLALLNLEIFSASVSFSFLPVAAIYLWPRAASYSWSLFGVFLLGLFYDEISASPLGMWTLALLVLFIIMGGGISHKGGVVLALSRFTLSVFLVLTIVFFIGRFFLGQWPQISVLLINALASIIIFPILYWIRSLFLALRGPGETLGIHE